MQHNAQPQEDLVNIRHHYDQINHFQALGNDDEAARADAKFHLAIAEASHNLVLITDDAWSVRFVAVQRRFGTSKSL